MSDQLISLKCPYCGSNMQIDEKRNLLVCPACGSEHLVKENVGSLVPPARENVNACPKCMRNDQVMKVTAIISSQVHETKGTTRVSDVRSDRKGRIYTTTRSVPIRTTEESTLAQKLRMPDRPSTSYKTGNSSFWRFFIYFVAVYYVLKSIIGLIQYISDPSTGGENELWSMVLTGLVFSIWSIYLYVQHKKKKDNYRDYDDQLNISVLPKWERAKHRWDNAYYCARDDLVFINGESTSISADQFSKWLLDTTP